jgi:hypothetical protein
MLGSRDVLLIYFPFVVDKCSTVSNQAPGSKVAGFLTGIVGIMTNDLRFEDVLSFKPFLMKRSKIGRKQKTKYSETQNKTTIE